MENRTIWPTAGDDPAPRHKSDLTRRILLMGIGIACLGFIPLFQGCDEIFSRGEKEKRTPGTDSVSRAAPPPIDAAVPANIQTATFALG